MAPGVYVMRDKSGRVIYVGKAKKLKNRVSQYFQDTAAHSPKTKTMVSKIDSFDVIVAASEFEALVLECSLIKQHMPQYNILLKDDKGYPYLRLDMKESYPSVTMVNKVSNDGANYYGPYGSRGITQDLLETIRLTLKLPGCTKKFPRDIGKGRPCLNYHLNQCSGWCQEGDRYLEYRRVIEQARQLLLGNYKAVVEEIRQEMIDASESLNFELAASLRDRMKAVEALGQKQLVTAGTMADTDVIGFVQTTTKSCFTVLHFRGGNLLDKEYEILSAVDNSANAVSSLMKQYYLSRGCAPKIVLLPFEIEDRDVFEHLLEQRFKKKTQFRVPQRGENLRLVELAMVNAKEEAERITSKEEHMFGLLQQLGKMLTINPPKRIESFDISNISNTDIVASMIVFQDGKPLKSAYKRFKIENLTMQNDYESMRQVISRRFAHYINNDAGFESSPDLILIDGGAVHAATAQSVLQSYNLDFPICGMVKDDRHRTKSLVTPDGKEIAIIGQQAVYSFIGNIQEETHRFAISYHRQLRSKRLKYSELDGIVGIGIKRKQALLKTFKSISAIRDATQAELEHILPRDAAENVYNHFHSK